MPALAYASIALARFAAGVPIDHTRRAVLVPRPCRNGSSYVAAEPATRPIWKLPLEVGVGSGDGAGAGAGSAGYVMETSGDQALPSIAVRTLYRAVLPATGAGVIV